MKERVPLQDAERRIAAERARMRAENERAAVESLTERRRVLLLELGKADRRSGQNKDAALSELSQVERRLRDPALTAHVSAATEGRKAQRE